MKDKLKYLNLNDNYHDLKYNSHTKKDKLKNIGKLFGKSIYNTGVFTFKTAIPEIIKSTAEVILKDPNATEEQKEKARERLEKYKK